jgi:hypothetical protein
MFAEDSVKSRMDLIRFLLCSFIPLYKFLKFDPVITKWRQDNINLIESVLYFLMIYYGRYCRNPYHLIQYRLRSKSPNWSRLREQETSVPYGNWSLIGTRDNRTQGCWKPSSSWYENCAADIVLESWTKHFVQPCNMLFPSYGLALIVQSCWLNI